MKKLVFLDMDGVITHQGTDYQIDPLCVARLNTLIDRTGAEVVISSSWRLMFRPAIIAARLEHAGFRGKVVGQTPRLPGYNRGKEIETFLSDVKDQICFVILDDVPDVDPLSSQLVLTDELIGLQDKDVERAVALLDDE